MKKNSNQWTDMELWRVRRMRVKQAKLLRQLAQDFGAKTKTDAKYMLKKYGPSEPQPEVDEQFRQRLEREN